MYFVSGNKKKIEEVRSILNYPFETTEIELEEIQSLDIEEVARKKAESAFEILKHPVFVDDAGFYVDAWNGFPGPFIKFILKSGNDDLLFSMMKGTQNRKATVRAVIAFHDGKDIHTFIGEVIGEIPQELRGEFKPGWWDRAFIPEGSSKTYAEMGQEEKNKISHRRRALEKFKEFILKNNY